MIEPASADCKRPSLEGLAARFVERTADVWAQRGLPRMALVNAVTVWGLQEATLGAGPHEVAEGLERMAASIREAGDPLDAASGG